MIKTSLRLFIFLAALLSVPSLYAATLSASDILAKMRSAVLANPSIEAIFTINGGEGAIHGSASIAGSKFKMTTPQFDVWYNGKTQWTYLKKSREVSISEPDASELMASNPFSILSAHDSYYTLRRLKDSAGRYKIEMRPKDKDTTVSRIEVFVNSKTWLPSAIVVDFDGNRSMSVVIDDIHGASKLPDASFVYDSNKYPATEIIDLR